MDANIRALNFPFFAISTFFARKFHSLRIQHPPSHQAWRMTSNYVKKENTNALTEPKVDIAFTTGHDQYRLSQTGRCPTVSVVCCRRLTGWWRHSAQTAGCLTLTTRQSIHSFHCNSTTGKFHWSQRQRNYIYRSMNQAKWLSVGLMIEKS